MTRLTVVNHFPLIPARNGGERAVMGLAGALAAYWPTEVVWTQRKTSGSQIVDIAGHHIKATAVPNRWLQRKVTRWLRHGIGRIDHDIGSMFFSRGNRLLVKHLLDVVADGDVLLLAHPWLWPAVQQVLRQRRALLVYDAHNVELLLKQESLRPGRISAWVLDHVQKLEAGLVHRADLTLACTQRDADQLASIADVPGTRLLVGSKGVAPSSRADAMAAARVAARVQQKPKVVAIFVGSKHPPNNEAARWIIQTLAPACPQWQFHIVGQCGPAAAVVPNTRNVHLHGQVDDLWGLLASADVALNPVIQGSGINMKLFEYLQCGLPTLSTPFGARGFESLGQSGLVVAEREAFAETLATLVADPLRYSALAAEGPACVRQHFIWDAVAGRIHHRLQPLLVSAA